MADCLLYHMPGSCSRVALVALERIGAPYRDRSVDLFGGEHRQPAFLALNPKAKVPVLEADGAVLTELPAILGYLATTYPAAGLLPLEPGGGVPIACWSDMMWLAGGVHPLASRMFRPFMFSEADEAGVKAIATGLLGQAAAIMNTRLADRPWWYGTEWSVVDSFVAWIFGVAVRCGFAIEAFAALKAMCDRAVALPYLAQALDRERAAVARDRMKLPPGMVIS